MRIPNRLAIVILLTCAGAGAADAADWFVDPLAAAGGAGGGGAPFQGLEAAAGKAVRGDRILLKRAATHRIAAAVAIAAGVTVTGYGTGVDPEVTASRRVAMTAT